MTTTIKPLNDRILVKRVMKETMTTGGLHIPETRQLKSRWGEVLAVGPGRWKKNTHERIPIDECLKPGVVIRFKGTAGEELDIDGEEGFVMLREGEVEGLAEDGPIED